MGIPNLPISSTAVRVPVKNGQTSVTAAKEGFPYPVGTPIPVAEYSKELQKKEK
jgi:hypothetical protein